MRHILILDDEANVLQAPQRVLRLEFPADALHIELFADPFDALSRCTEFQFDAVLSDFRMPLMSDVEFLRNIKELAPGTVRIMLSASTEFDTVTSAVNEAEIFRPLSKPWAIDDLKNNLALAFVRRDEVLAELRLANQQRLQKRPAHAAGARGDAPGGSRAWHYEGELGSGWRSHLVSAANKAHTGAARTARQASCPSVANAWPVYFGDAASDRSPPPQQTIKLAATSISSA